MKNEFIDPLIVASKTVLQSIISPNVVVGEPYNACIPSKEGTVGIYVGITGGIRGQVVFNMDIEIACYIASKMIMMPVNKIDDTTRSAVSELCNMIMGNTASLLFDNGIEIDITPPAFLLGENLRYLGTDKVTTLCIPFDIEYKSKINIGVFVSKK